ncbi:MAG: aspartyl protease family protein [Candidatus Nanoarchaeia archaeon]|nr:aspartyl protease family protein [Candidatus Nanoarchaeia archaeon]
MIISLSCNAKKHYNLQKLNNHIFITLTLNNKPALFIIDSGSTKSIIDISKSKVFAFNYIEFGDQKYMGIGGLSQIYMVYDYTVKEISTPFLGVNLSQMTSLFDANGAEIAGILGSDFLNDNEVIINFKNNTLTMK